MSKSDCSYQSNKSLLKDLLHIQLPVTLELGISYLIHTINISFIGHLDKPNMVAAIALASLFINMFCQSIFVGFNYLIATLGSQAYGAGDYKYVGTILNKGRVSLCLFFIPILLVLMFSK